MSKVLVTGGAGFIGSHVVDLLIEKGYKVVVVDDLSSGYAKNLNRKARFCKVDIRDQKKLRDVFRKEQPQFVVHAAAQVQVVRSVNDPAEDASINVIGGINVLECCKAYKVKKFVYMCTGGALYGEPNYLPADEEHLIMPIAPYGASKHCIEHYCYLYNYNFGLDYVVLRFSNVYGPRDDPKSGRLIPNFVGAMLSKKRPFITGDGTQGRDFIYVLDVARAVVKALEKRTKSRYFNIGTEKVISVNDIYSITESILKTGIRPKYVAKRPGEVQQIYLKASLAYKELGWKASVGIVEGLKAYIEWVFA
ncbi:MAG: SDR family NAD(P)-dependent oxidoreductase [Candidatus Woesearchaeota archaeon]